MIIEGKTATVEIFTDNIEDAALNWVMSLRSQQQNKERARQRLMLKLREIGDSIQQEMKDDKWSQHTSLERGNPVKKFSGPL